MVSVLPEARIAAGRVERQAGHGVGMTDRLGCSLGGREQPRHDLARGCRGPGRGCGRSVMSPPAASIPYPATARNDWPWASGLGETAIA